MSNDDHPIIASDAMLTAFIDGELSPEDRSAIEHLIEKDPAVAARLATLMRASLPFREAFDALLQEAPTDRLAARLPLAGISSHDRPVHGRRRLLTAMAASTVAGVAIDRVAATFLKAPAQDEAVGWRSVVANYMMLYTADTLSDLPQDAASKAKQVAAVAKTMGLALSLPDVEISGAEFKRAQILRFKGKPLAQIVFLDPEWGPVALCFTHDGGKPDGLHTEEKFGMNIVYWSMPQHSFLIIGRRNMQHLKSLASDLRLRLPA